METVMKRLQEQRKKGPLHITLLDPDKQSPQDAAQLARLSEEAGSHAIMVGGSHASILNYLDETVRAIKKTVSIPVILFPSSHSALTKEADAVFFMSLLNSRSLTYVVDEQVKGSILVKSWNLEPLSMGYLIVDSNSRTSVEFVGDAKPIPRNKSAYAVSYALAAKYMGMKFVYLEGGSGAKDPVPSPMIQAVKEAIGPETFLIVGGGIRTPDIAKEKIQAGADIIVTGTLAEDNPDQLRSLITAISKGNQE